MNVEECDNASHCVDHDSTSVSQERRFTSELQKWAEQQQEAEPCCDKPMRRAQILVFGRGSWFALQELRKHREELHALEAWGTENELDKTIEHTLTNRNCVNIPM